jgi:hypothetical protein
MSREPSSAPGPFRASQIRDGDPYELSDGHAIRCMTAGGRHGGAHNVGGRVLGTDPAAVDKTGTDVGITWNDGKNLRAPDIIVGALEQVPGWQKTLPPLAVEYADTGQDEAELQQKITELLAGGTQLVWVVRLVGPLRVEVYSAGKPMRIYNADEELTAPGILHNPVLVRALVDPDAATTAVLRNVLTPYGYKSVEEIETKKLLEGEVRALVGVLLGVLAARGLAPNDAQVAAIQSCRDPATLQKWTIRAAVADSLAGLFD